jgi:hypothetical protein
MHTITCNIYNSDVCSDVEYILHIPAAMADLPTPDSHKSNNRKSCNATKKNMEKTQASGNSEQEQAMNKHLVENYPP